jgi:superfamily II RNA helicase
VLVSAPTGAGKTLVANYAIGRELEREQRSNECSFVNYD